MVHCVKGSRKVEENKYYPFLTIKHLQDVVMDTDEGSFGAVTWPIRPLEWIEQHIFVDVAMEVCRDVPMLYPLVIIQHKICSSLHRDG